MKEREMVVVDKKTELFMDYMNGKISVDVYRVKSIQYQEEREKQLKKMGLLSET